MTLPIKDSPDFMLTELQKKVIQNDIRMDIFEEDMERRKNLGLLNEKYIQCMRRLRAEWEPKLAVRGVDVMSLDDERLCDVIFAQSDYKNRSQRDAELPKILS